jgi:REP element-mobilizing transposase RayT
MPDYRRANTKGGTYFFTVVTFRRQKILCDKDVRAALRNAIQTTQEIHPFTIDAWYYFQIIYIVSGHCQRMTPILAFAGR